MVWTLSRKGGFNHFRQASVSEIPETLHCACDYDIKWHQMIVEVMNVGGMCLGERKNLKKIWKVSTLFIINATSPEPSFELGELSLIISYALAK